MMLSRVILAGVENVLQPLGHFRPFRFVLIKDLSPPLFQSEGLFNHQERIPLLAPYKGRGFKQGNGPELIREAEGRKPFPGDDFDDSVLSRHFTASKKKPCPKPARPCTYK
jgi:hypothetical protein